MRRTSWIIAASMGMVLFIVVPSRAAPAAVPVAAREVIAQVQSAASTSDYQTLRSLMAEDFSWSFGGDASADQAIAEWRKQPRYLRQLASVTKSRCSYEGKYVDCPANPRTAFRAGFTKIDGRWKMAYFVEGD